MEPERSKTMVSCFRDDEWANARKKGNFGERGWDQEEEEKQLEKKEKNDWIMEKRKDDRKENINI